MADLDLSHTADIIKAAIPYVDSKLTGMAELFAKFLDLMGSLKYSTKSSNTLTATGLQGIFNGFQGINIDIEGLLKGIRPICTQKERDIVDKILNIFQMKKVFEMYNTMSNAMNTMQEYGFNFGDSGDAKDTENKTNTTNNFSAANLASMFETFQNISNNSNSFSSNQGPDTSNEENRQSEVNQENPEFYSDSSGYNPFFATSQKEPAPPPLEEEKTPPPPTTNPINGKMLDMLKTMVPPEQRSTFENLSMLLNTMSYDSTSKEDNSNNDKE